MKRGKHEHTFSPMQTHSDTPVEAYSHCAIVCATCTIMLCSSDDDDVDGNIISVLRACLDDSVNEFIVSSSGTNRMNITYFARP